jgi:RNA recognition motif-containing protein
MPSKDEAEKAISGLNDKDLKGRPLTVNEARPRPCQDRDWEARPRTDRPRTGGGAVSRSRRNEDGGPVRG